MGYDYSRPGAYFITFQVAGRDRCLSSIEEPAAHVRLTPLGLVVRQIWEELPGRFPGFRPDNMVIMPDHVHAIIFLTDHRSCGALIHQGPGRKDRDARGALMNQGPTGSVIHQGPTGSLIQQGPTGSLVQQGPTGTVQPMMADPRMILGKIIRHWKAASTHRIRRAANPGFAWQSRYWEHVIRSRDALDRIRAYIDANPRRWMAEHPG